MSSVMGGLNDVLTSVELVAHGIWTDEESTLWVADGLWLPMSDPRLIVHVQRWVEGHSGGPSAS